MEVATVSDLYSVWAIAASLACPGSPILAVHKCHACVKDEEGTPIKQDIKKGKLRFYPYNINWNYGLLPQTWEDPGHHNTEVDAAVCLHIFMWYVLTFVSCSMRGLTRTGEKKTHAKWYCLLCTFCSAALRIPHPLQGDNDPVDVVEIGSQTGVMGAVYKVSLDFTNMFSTVCRCLFSANKQLRMLFHGCLGL